MKKTIRLFTLTTLIASLLFLTACGGSSSEINPSDKIISGKLLPPEGDNIYFGAMTNFGNLENSITEAKIHEFDELSVKPIAWSYFSNNWSENDAQGNHFSEIRYPYYNIHKVVEAGKTPFVRLLPWTSPHEINNLSKKARQGSAVDLVTVCHESSTLPHNESILIHNSELEAHLDQGDIEGLCFDDFSMQSIIDGYWDDELKKWANEAKDDRDDNGDPIHLLMTFTVEMNGYWFPWSGLHNGGVENNYKPEDGLADGPERFRDAYRHIIDLFKDEGATNITWFFSPDTIDPNLTWTPFLAEEWNSAKNYYPGDDYIDWIGITLYGAGSYYGKWSLFSDQLAREYKNIADISDNKPIALLEFGVTGNHVSGSKINWLNDAFATILNNEYLHFQAISYWNDQWSHNGVDVTMNIDSSEETLTTFQQLISNPRFISELRFSE